MVLGDPHFRYGKKKHVFGVFLVCFDGFIVVLLGCCFFWGGWKIVGLRFLEGFQFHIIFAQCFATA